MIPAVNITARVCKSLFLDVGINPVDLIELGFVKGMKETSGTFDIGKFQLRQIFKAYHIIETGIDVLRPQIMDSEKDALLFEGLIGESDRTPKYPSIPHIHESSLSSYC